MPQSAVNFVEGHSAVIAGVVESQDDLIIVNEHGIEECLYQPFLAGNIGVIHIDELVQEKFNVLFLSPKILFQLGRSQSELQFGLLLLQLVHTLPGAFVEDTGFNGTEQIGNRLFGFQ